MNALQTKLLSLLGMVDVIKSEPAKHALLDYIEMSGLMAEVGAIDLANVIADEAGVRGMAHLVQVEGHTVASLLGQDGPICQAIVTLADKSKERARYEREEQEARNPPKADPFNGIRLAVKGPNGSN